MAKTRVAINGFGRIGRHAFKIAWAKKDIEIVAVNDLTDNKMLAHLLKYDTAYPDFKPSVSFDEKHLVVGGEKILSFSERDPSALPWKKLKVDVVLECTGIFRTSDTAGLHLKAGAKRVIISAPAKGDDIKGFVRGVNCRTYNNESIIDTASCTTNCTTPPMAVIDREFGVEKALLTTIHAYTAGQNLQDGPSGDMRRARAAAQNIVPTSTGAAIATTKVLHELEGKFDGMAIRVPVITVSLIDVTAVLKKNVTVEEVNAAFTKAAGKELKGILDVTEEPLVSSDFIGNRFSSTVDLSLTKVIGGNLLKFIAWYDNEWGYASRLVEMVSVVGKKSKLN
ncbi:MAG: type I glyceraldehyde-3-phosphate dehydrogenase [Candidatus Magasanikbacteria bacterium]